MNRSATYKMKFPVVIIRLCPHAPPIVRIIFLLLYLLYGSPDIYGQERFQITSGWNNIYTIPSFTDKDTARVMQGMRKGTLLQFKYPDSAIQYFQTAFDLSRDKGFNDGAVLALINIGRAESYRGNKEKSLMLFQSAFRYCNQLFYYKELATDCYNNIGYIHFYQGAYRQAAYYFDSALQTEGNRQSGKESRQMVVSWNNLSAVYIRLDQADMALQYLLPAERISRKQEYEHELARTLCNKGQALIVLKRYIEARRYYQEGLGIAIRNNYTELQQALNNSMGELMLKLKEPAAAIQYFKKTEQLGENTNPFYASILPGYSMATAYFQLKEYQKAEYYMLRTLKDAQRLNYTDDQMNGYKTLSFIYEAMGDFERALQQERIYERLRDSMFTKEKAKDIHELQIKYNSSRKDRELTQKQLKIVQQRASIQQKNTWIWISIWGIMGLAVILLLLYRNNGHKQNLMAGKINIMEHEQEIKLLKASQNGEEKERIRIGRELHDGIGGLLSATKLQMGKLRLMHGTLRETPDFKKTIVLIDEATDEVRKIAHNLMPEILLKGGITEAVKSFCERIGAVFGAPDIKVLVYGEIPRMEPTFELLVYRIVQELVNNILKHAEAKHILVQLNAQQQFFHITIEDDGKGIEVGKLEESDGIGLKNIISRVATMNGRIEIDSTPSAGTSIYIDFESQKFLLNKASV